MTFRNILKTKFNSVEKISIPAEKITSTQASIVHSDINTQEFIYPSNSTVEEIPSSQYGLGHDSNDKTVKRLLGKLRPVSVMGSISSHSSSQPKSIPPTMGRLSKRLRLGKPRTSEKVPNNLQEIEIITEANDKFLDKRADDIRSQWERRATVLALKNEESQNTQITPAQSPIEEQATEILSVNRVINTSEAELAMVNTSPKRYTGDSIHEAIRLHEAGELETSTMMFGRLAKSPDDNNTLSQVLYGLSLRHGWGCTPDPVEALKYLSAAASNAATVENFKTQTIKDEKAKTVKGELVLAIYELANCFRHGWGVPVDKLAAKQYYETAANLGDTDAMNEVAQCYLDGFGCKKDKFTAARYYRMAEQKGSKILGNTWIWKEKYDHPKIASHI